jgi:hypothetical protein
MMALGTISKPSGVRANDHFGGKKANIRDVQLSAGANYTTGGETITPRAVGLSQKIEQVVGAMATTASGTTSRTVVPLYQADGSVKLVVQTTASAEAAGNSDQSTFTARLTFIGI